MKNERTCKIKKPEKTPKNQSKTKTKERTEVLIKRKTFKEAASVKKWP